MRAAPPAATPGSSSGGGGRRGERKTSKELRHSGSRVCSSGHPTGGGAHTALALARRGHDHRKLIVDFWKQNAVVASSSSSSGTATAVQQQCSSTSRPIHNGSTQLYAAGAGWDFHFLTILHLPGESAIRPRERLFMPPGSRSWDSSAVVSPGTPRADVWGGRGTGVRSLGAGWRLVERRVVSVLF